MACSGLKASLKWMAETIRNDKGREETGII
jgi:hypothetical protein